MLWKLFPFLFWTGVAVPLIAWLHWFWFVLYCWDDSVSLHTTLLRHLRTSTDALKENDFFDRWKIFQLLVRMMKVDLPARIFLTLFPKRKQISRFTLTHNCHFWSLLQFPVCDLTMLSVLRPTGPAGRIPLGPCSNTAPSDLLVVHSQPPKRLVDSNKMTWRTKHDHFLCVCKDLHCNLKLKLLMLRFLNFYYLLNHETCFVFMSCSHLCNRGNFAEVIWSCQSPNPSSKDCNCTHELLVGKKRQDTAYMYVAVFLTWCKKNHS